MVNSHYALLIKHYVMKTYGGVDVYIDVFLTSALVEGEWLASRQGRLVPRVRAPGAQLLGGWVGPRAGLSSVDKNILSWPETETLGRPIRRQSLPDCDIPIPKIMEKSHWNLDFRKLLFRLKYSNWGRSEYFLFE
jgi:hypothetical protein